MEMLLILCSTQPALYSTEYQEETKHIHFGFPVKSKSLGVGPFAKSVADMQKRIWCGMVQCEVQGRGLTWSRSLYIQGGWQHLPLTL